jgi:hypothetical protein
VSANEELAREYLRSRGVLDETFIAHRAEIDEWCASETIAKKLKRDLYRTRYDTNWSSVSAILWFPLCNLRGDIISYLARPLPNYNGRSSSPLTRVTAKRGFPARRSQRARTSRSRW